MITEIKGCDLPLEAQYEKSSNCMKHLTERQTRNTGGHREMATMIAMKSERTKPILNTAFS